MRVCVPNKLAIMILNLGAGNVLFLKSLCPSNVEEKLHAFMDTTPAKKFW